SSHQPLPDTSVWPSGASAKQDNFCCPAITATFARLRTSHTRIVLSRLHEIKVMPSAVNVTPVTASEWPTRVALSVPVARSHSLMVLSALAVARVLSSGEKTTALKIGRAHV